MVYLFSPDFSNIIELVYVMLSFFISVVKSVLATFKCDDIAMSYLPQIIPLILALVLLDLIILILDPI